MRATCGPGYGRIKHDPENEERVVGRFASDVVGQRCPKESTGNIEQRKQPGKSGRDRRDLRFLRCGKISKAFGNADQIAAEYFLQQRRSHSKNADARGDVEAEHAPYKPKLFRLRGNIERNI